MDHGWYKQKTDEINNDKFYRRLDFIDYEKKIGYYCTRGNDCTYCRYAPHARDKTECIYVDVLPYPPAKTCKLSGMKEGMCIGCDNLASVDQWITFDKTGTRRLKFPYKMKKPYCRAFSLHLDYVDRLIEVQSGNGICPRYKSGGIS